MGYQLGIDFGTSTTKIALRAGAAIPIPLPIGSDGAYSMPSVVAYRRTKLDKAELYSVGEDAVASTRLENVTVVSEIKRCLLASATATHPDPAVTPWWDAEARCVRLWADTWGPEDVIRSILAEALDRAVHRARELGYGKDIDGFTVRGVRARFGCPVTADLAARKVLAEVARRLGFQGVKVNDIYEEPVLASLAYVHLDVEFEPGERILVYDLGGGSFDTSVVQVDRGGRRGNAALTVFATDGEPFCGGSDIDRSFGDHLLHRVAVEYLGFDQTEGIEALRGSLSPGDFGRLTQLLRIRAREAKEILSSTDAAAITLPPEILGPGVLSVTRRELEEATKSSHVFERTSACVLRGWRRARMLLRNAAETANGFYLDVNPTTGALSGPVLKLGHEDIMSNITRVLVVGGATKMPLIRRQLEALWGPEKLLPEIVIEPVDAAAMGGAWQQEEVGTIVDRLPFSIVMRTSLGDQVLYSAYAPTVRYYTLGLDQRVVPFRSEPLRLPDGNGPVAIELQAPDGQVVWSHAVAQPLSAGCFLEIDGYGYCSLRTRSKRILDLPNPAQHRLQRELWERSEADRKQREEETLKRGREEMTKSPFLEN